MRIKYSQIELPAMTSFSVDLHCPTAKGAMPLDLTISAIDSQNSKARI